MTTHWLKISGLPPHWRCFFIQSYCKHPHLLSCYEEHEGKVFYSFNNLLHMATSVNASDHHSSVELAQKGALLNCVDKTWSSLLYILALSTVTLTNIYYFFLDLGEIC